MLNAMTELTLQQTAIAKGLRPKTVQTYRERLAAIGAHLDMTLDDAQQRIDGIANPNTRRATALAVRSIIGLEVRIGLSVSRQWEMPTIEDIHTAAAGSQYATRLYLMAVCSLRLAEAAAVTRDSLHQSQLVVDRQVDDDLRFQPVKAGEGLVYCPTWLCERVTALDAPVRPKTLQNHLAYLSRKHGKHFNASTVRSFSANNLLRSSVDLPTVSRHLRHASVEMTAKHYAQVDPRMKTVLDEMQPVA